MSEITLKRITPSWLVQLGLATGQGPYDLAVYSRPTADGMRETFALAYDAGGRFFPKWVYYKDVPFGWIKESCIASFQAVKFLNGHLRGEKFKAGLIDLAKDLGDLAVVGNVVKGEIPAGLEISKDAVTSLLAILTRQGTNLTEEQGYSFLKNGWYSSGAQHVTRRRRSEPSVELTDGELLGEETLKKLSA